MIVAQNDARAEQEVIVDVKSNWTGFIFRPIDSAAELLIYVQMARHLIA